MDSTSVVIKLILTSVATVVVLGIHTLGVDYTQLHT